MSFPTQSDSYGYGVAPNICNLCFNVGETPDPIFMCIAGIERSPLAGGGDPPAPSGVFELSPNGACHWDATIDNYIFDFQTGVGLSNVHVDHTGGQTFFFATSGVQCNPWFPNSYTNPAVRKYVGGWLILCHPMQDGMIPVPDIMALLNIAPAEETFCRVFPMATSQAVYRFSRQYDKSNVRILLDHS